MKTAYVITVYLALAVPAATLSGDTGVVIIPAHQIESQLAQLGPQATISGSSGSTLASFGNLALKLSVRTTSGGAEIHAHFDDLMIVEQGSATLVTGGTVIDAKEGSDGETHGPGIQNGRSQTIAARDVIIIAAGVPRQLLIAPHTIYSAMVAKVKE